MLCVSTFYACLQGINNGLGLALAFFLTSPEQCSGVNSLAKANISGANHLIESYTSVSCVWHTCSEEVAQPDITEL